jgi:hypothetical protein
MTWDFTEIKLLSQVMRRWIPMGNVYTQLSSISPPSLSAHDSLWIEFYYCTAVRVIYLRYTATSKCPHKLCWKISGAAPGLRNFLDILNTTYVYGPMSHALPHPHHETAGVLFSPPLLEYYASFYLPIRCSFKIFPESLSFREIQNSTII